MGQYESREGKDGSPETGLASQVNRLISFTDIKGSHLGSVVVSMLATGPKGRGFKPGRSDGVLRTTEIRSTPSSRREVNPEVPCRKILRNVKDKLMYVRYWIRKIITPSSIPLTRSQMYLLVVLTECSGGQFRSFPQPTSSSPWLSTLRYYLGDEQ
jgi:hypothetical protein